VELLTKVFTAFFGKKSEKDIKRLIPIVEEINDSFLKLESLSDDQIKARYDSIRKEFREAVLSKKKDLIEKKVSSQKIDEALLDIENKYLESKMVEVFAIVKDVCRRLCGTKYLVMGQETTWGMVPYDVQLMGGIVLFEGKIAEMKTGEGKTLVSTMPIILNAITGRGVHVITVNDYLAERDSIWMGLVFKYLNLSVGCILSRMDSSERSEMYGKDITYGTNSQFGFDYLRDNMSVSADDQVQRAYAYAIVDEVDSVLIDEARTPLIISGQVDAPPNPHFSNWKGSIVQLIKEQNNLSNELISEAEELLGKDDSKAGLNLLLAQRGTPKNKKLLKVFQKQGTQQLVNKTESEYIRDKKLQELDEQLYFSIDERSNIVDLSEKGREFLSPENPENFVIPDLGEVFHEIENNTNLSSSDIISKKQEAQSLHAERNERIHSINQLLKAYSLFERDVDYIVQEGKVMIVDEHTGRVMHGRRFSDGMHAALEAKENLTIEKESQTMATITIQNYFRMYQKLAGMTGTAVTESREFMEIYKLDVVEIPTNQPIARVDEEDLIYRTRKEKFNAVIKQIQSLHEKGQPILVGTTSVEESETLSRMLKRTGVPHNVLNAKQHQSEAEIVARAGHECAITISTNMAGRGTDIKLGNGVKELDGLYILGTGRHESRRIDLQLRGRAGRQGDPGKSVFYLSLEDNLMRLFGSDRISKVMDRLGIEEGEVITHSMVTKSVERAQKKLEARNFGVRKHLLEYDDVMNQQREIVYDRRNFALHEDQVDSEVEEIISEYIDQVIDIYCADSMPINWDWPGLTNEILSTFSIDISSNRETIKKSSDLKSIISSAYTEAMTYNKEVVDPEQMDKFQKYVLLRTIDEKWREHLAAMDQLREGIGLRAYAQKNPLIEYKQEGFKMFEQMMFDTNKETISRISKMNLSIMAQRQSRSTNLEMKNDTNPTSMFVPPPSATGSSAVASRGQGPVQKTAPIVSDKKYGRNEKVSITNGVETKELKWKKAQHLVEQEGWKVVS
jgi:preprotein translocase subunit SecA